MTSVSNARKLATWHDTVPISDVLTVTTMDTLLQIALIKYHLQVHQHAKGTIPLVDMTDHHLNIIATPGISHCDHRDRYRINHSQSHSHNLRYRSSSHHDSHRSCSRSFHRPSHHNSSCCRSSSSHHPCHNTPHRRSSSHRNFSQDDSQSRTHKHNYKPTQRSSSSSQSTHWKPKDRKHKQVATDDPPSEYYSSDEQDSDSEDDLN